MAVTSSGAELSRDSGLLGYDLDSKELRGLKKAHRAKPEENPSTVLLRAEISRLQQQLHANQNQLERDRQFNELRRQGKTQRLIQTLKDPNSNLHPVMRHVLLAAGNALVVPHTFEAIHAFGRHMVAVNDSQERADEPQPTVVLSSRFNPDIPGVQHQVNFGYSAPGVGLVSGEIEKLAHWDSAGNRTYGSQPALTVMSSEEVGAVSPSSFNSHYVFNTGEVVEVDEHGHREETNLAAEDFIPVAGDLAIPLPTGTLDAPRSAKPVVWWENKGGVEAIPLPKVLGERMRATLAIGETAIPLAFKQWYQDLAEREGKEQGIVAQSLAIDISNRLGIELEA